MGLGSPGGCKSGCCFRPALFRHRVSESVFTHPKRPKWARNRRASAHFGLHLAAAIQAFCSDYVEDWPLDMAGCFEFFLGAGPWVSTGRAILALAVVCELFEEMFATHFVSSLR
jgi:hypothetical protein